MEQLTMRLATIGRLWSTMHWSSIGCLSTTFATRVITCLTTCQHQSYTWRISTMMPNASWTLWHQNLTRLTISNYAHRYACKKSLAIAKSKVGIISPFAGSLAYLTFPVIIVQEAKKSFASLDLRKKTKFVLKIMYWNYLTVFYAKWHNTCQMRSQKTASFHTGLKRMSRSLVKPGYVSLLWSMSYLGLTKRCRNWYFKDRQL